MKTAAEILKDNQRWRDDHATTWLEYMEALHQEISKPIDVDRAVAQAIANDDEAAGRVS